MSRGLVLVGAIALLALVGGPVSAASYSPCPGVPFAPPPPGAPPLPPITCAPGLVGIGNVPGVPIHPNAPTVGAGLVNDIFPVPVSVSPPVLQTRSLASSTACGDGYSYMRITKDVTLGNPNKLETVETAASNVYVTSPGSSEHSAVGLIDWHITTHGPSFNNWVQMGYYRGIAQNWTDNLPSNQVMIYLEFSTPAAYRFEPLLAVDQGTRHTFSITQDDAQGHYYSFWLDGIQKWAGVFLDYPVDKALAVNEDYNVDGFCEGGLADNNFFNISYPHWSIYAGHALGVVSPTPPWNSDQVTLTDDLPGMGYQCGSNPGRLYWYCGVSSG